MSFVSVAELTNRLGLGERAVQLWVQRGKIAEEYYRRTPTPGPGRQRLEIDPAGLPEAHRQTWVLGQIEAGELPDPGEDDVRAWEWQGAAQWRKREAKRRYRMLQAVPEEMSVKGRKKALKTYQASIPEEDQPGGTSYSAWNTYKNAYAEGGLPGLMPAPANRKGSSKVTETDYERYRDLYLTEDRRTARQCYRKVRGAAVREGRRMDDYPCCRTFENQLEKREDPDLVYVARHGKEAFYQKASPYITRDWQEVEAGSVYISDHRQLDVFVEDAQTGEIGRPWLTCWMDARSWKLLAWEIYLGHPNADRIILTFKRAISAHGLCRAVYIDNGKDYRCLDFAGRPMRSRPSTVRAETDRAETMLELLQVDAKFSLPYNARAKTIERRFRALIERVEKFLPGYAGSNPQRRPEATERRRKAGDVMPLSEMREHFAWTAQHLDGATIDGRIHGGRTPHEVWQTERDAVRRVDAKHLGLLCLRTARPRQVRRCELKVTPLESEDFHGLYRAPWMQRANGTKVYVRYDPADRSQVWVFEAEQGRFLGMAEPKPTVPAMATTEEDRALLERELAMQRSYMQDLERRKREIEEAQPSVEELKNWSEAAQAEEEARREAAGERPSEEERQAERVHLVQSDEAQGWMREADRQRQAGRAPLPYNPESAGDDDDDDIALWPDELD